MRSMRSTLYTTSVIMILLGVAAMLHPVQSFKWSPQWWTLTNFIGAGFIGAGINHLVRGLTMWSSPLRPLWLLPQGIVDLTIGVRMLLRLESLTSTDLQGYLLSIDMLFMLVIWMIFMSMMRLLSCFRLKKAGLRTWWVELIIGVLTAICAAVLWYSTFVARSAMIYFLMAMVFVGLGVIIIAESKLIYHS